MSIPFHIEVTQRLEDSNNGDLYGMADLVMPSGSRHPLVVRLVRVYAGSEPKSEEDAMLLTELFPSGLHEGHLIRHAGKFYVAVIRGMAV